jgi:hypothetical protein
MHVAEAGTLLGSAMTAESEGIASVVHGVDQACLKSVGSLRQSAEQSGIGSTNWMARIHGMRALGLLEVRSHENSDPRIVLVPVWE